MRELQYENGSNKAATAADPYKTPLLSNGNNHHHHDKNNNNNTPTTTTTNTITTNNNNNSSTRSVEDSVTVHSIPSLHGHLMRTHRNDRNPLRYYEVVKMLGEGSMGDVAKVRKRDSGGSARAEFVRQEQMRRCCFGGVFMRFVMSAICPPKNRFVPYYNDGSGSSNYSSTCSEDGKPTNNNPKVLEHAPSSLITYGHKDIYYALKSIHLDRVTDPLFLKELQNEIEILKEMDHPHIVRAMETFAYHHRVFLVLELCSGGDLYVRDPYSEREAAKIVESLTSAIAYMHSKNITHRDLKYENVMFANNAADAPVKIIDFGLSKKYAKDNDVLHDTVGTCYTFAPEVIRGNYTQLADLWSLGVICFMLLSSSMPFYGKDRKQVLHRILRGTFTFAGRRWRFVSPQAKQFVSRLLQKNVQVRPTAEQVLEDEWLKQEEENNNSTANSDESIIKDEDERDDIQATLQTFADYGKLKKLALMVIAYKSTSEEIGYLRRMFGKFDKFHDGEISFPEFKLALAEYYDYNDEEMRRLFDAADIDGTGVIHYSEFLAATIEARGSIREECLAEAFDRLDSDDSGYITPDNLKEFLGQEIPTSYVEEIMKEARVVSNRISYKEFLAMWQDSKLEKKRKSAKEQVKRRRRRRKKHERNDSVTSSASLPTDCSLDDYSILSDLSDPTLEQQQQQTAVACFNQGKEVSMRLKQSGVWV